MVYLAQFKASLGTLSAGFLVASHGRVGGSRLDKSDESLNLEDSEKLRDFFTYMCFF